MADKDFKVKNRLFVNGLSQNSGVILATNNNLDSHTNVPTQYGGTGTTQSPNAGQVLYSSAGTNYAPTDISSLTISSSGGSTITAASASTKGLIIKGATSQTANLQEWQDSVGTVKAFVRSDGFIRADASLQTPTIYGTSATNGTQANIATAWTFLTNVATNTGIIVKGAASQTANLQEWQNSAGTVLARINAGGVIKSSILAGLTDGYSLIQFNYDTNGVGITTGAAAQKGLIIRGAASQTANLQEWQNSAGTVLASIDSNGQLRTPQILNIASFNNSRLQMTNTGSLFDVGVASNVALRVRGAPSQTANLQEWQDSAGTVLSKVDSSGIVTATNGFITSASYKLANGIISLGYTNTYTATIGVVAGTPTNETTLIVKKKDSTETGNLQEWQNSAGTVLASISAAGNLTVQDLTVNGTTTTINSTTLTVDDKNIELASVASPTDTTADGAGITIKGATDKTFNWVQSTGAFTSSEPISTPALSVSGNSVSSNITLAAGKRYFVDTTSARTLTLPASPSLGDEIKIFDASNSALTNNITVQPNGNKINGVVDTLIIDSNAASVFLIYTGSTYGWMVA